MSEITDLKESVAALERKLEEAQAVIFDAHLQLALFANAALSIAQAREVCLDTWSLQRAILQLRRETGVWVAMNVLAGNSPSNVVKTLLH